MLDHFEAPWVKVLGLTDRKLWLFPPSSSASADKTKTPRLTQDIPVGWLFCLLPSALIQTPTGGGKCSIHPSCFSIVTYYLSGSEMDRLPAGGGHQSIIRSQWQITGLWEDAVLQGLRDRGALCILRNTTQNSGLHHTASKLPVTSVLLLLTSNTEAEKGRKTNLEILFLQHDGWSDIFCSSTICSSWTNAHIPSKSAVAICAHCWCLSGKGGREIVTVYCTVHTRWLCTGSEDGDHRESDCS